MLLLHQITNNIVTLQDGGRKIKAKELEAEVEVGSEASRRQRKAGWGCSSLGKMLM